MQQLDDGTLILSASDLTDHLACDHLTQQKLAMARGERGRPRPVDDPHADLIRERGDAHEREWLQRLSSAAGGHVDVNAGPSRDRSELEAAALRTAEAMQAGAPLIFQAQLFDGRWQGRVDFLRRIDLPSALGHYAYEILDTKLARQLKPHVVHQMALYSRLLARIQGVEAPEAHLILGDGTVDAIELGRYRALHRHVARRLEEVAAAEAVATYPDPVEHCDICALAAECRARRVADDHLSLVANVSRDQREKLVDLGYETLAELADAPEGAESGRLGAERFALMRNQAALQVISRETRLPTHRHLSAEAGRGYALLPPPSPGDVFFDLEGDPYVLDGGIEYLWGWWTAGDAYACAWAHDADAEKAAFEAFIDHVVALRDRYPDLHVYHYAPHERAKLRSLSVDHATREVEVDAFLRAEVLVDLYAVVRQALQVGEESYGLKKLERHTGFRRLEHRIREGGGSIVAYETWLKTGDGEILEAIRAYNEEDCRSTAELRDWLLDDMKPEAEGQFGLLFADLEVEPEEKHEPPAWLPDALALTERLAVGLPTEGRDDSPEQTERRLLSHLVLYHYRENKADWWRYFDLIATAPEDLVDDRDALASLRLDPSVEPTPHKNSLDYVFRFPPQEFKLGPGDVVDPTTEEGYKLVRVADDHVVLRRGKNKPPPAPNALIEGAPFDVTILREAIEALAESVLAGESTFAAVRALLRREPPRLTSGRLGEDIDALISAALRLDCSVLPVQGPPGTGKTYRGAWMIVAALRAGLRVGVTAQSHAVIQNLLTKVEERAFEEGLTVVGIYKGDGYTSAHELVETASDNGDVTEEHRLVAGTSWLFARPQHRQAFDLLFIDEAGQFSLANAAAVGAAAKSLVLLGDPQQLPQVTQADHPDGAGASVLGHVLNGASTIAPDRGVLLTETWRMHPDVCEFVSERSYDRKLRSREACSLRRLDAPLGDLTGTGLRALAVAHEGRSQASPEEAEVIAAACENLLAGATVADDHGVIRELVADDILVVAPYNMAVRCITDHVPEGVRVGTVDRFQGQQAPVVFYAMTCSSGDEVPRGLDFLFDDHRLNVAISRAECLAVLVHSPRLLDADCHTLRAMELVDGVCRFVEMAGAPSSHAAMV